MPRLKTERPVRVKGSLWGALTDGRLEKAVDRRSKYKAASNRRKHTKKK